MPDSFCPQLILLYDKPFWDDNRDMFGLLNEADYRESLEPEHYAKKRGRFYLIWNASKISGRPMLVALMAGHSAHEAEKTDTNTLLGDINNRLRKTFAPKHVSAPVEVIVTRWKRDPFTRGTYSYVAPETRPGDYDLMAKSVGNLHFAGEATCGTHPATVHGAFLSGLRVAADVMESMAGPITLPDQLVGPPTIKTEMAASYAAQRPAPYSAPIANHSAAPIQTELTPQQTTEPAITDELDNITLANIPAAPTTTLARKSSGPPKQSVCAADQSFWVQPAAYDSADLNYEAAIFATILGQIGERPPKPTRPGVNPFLLYTKAKWDEVKAFCASGHPDAATGKDMIRQTIGKWWRAASEEEKEPYLEESRRAQEEADKVRREYEGKAKEWDDEARRIRREYMAEHPPPMVVGGKGSAGVGASMVGVSRRKTNVSNCVVLDHA